MDDSARRDWATEAKRILRAEMARRGVTQAELARRLAAAGQPIEVQSLNNKIARGAFSAAFLLQCLDLIGAKRVELD